MTDRLPSFSTIVSPSQTAVPAFASSVSVPETLLKKQETVEEEPYTIKCICGFSDDDGNTIYCETCDTWQHIECYYPDSVQDALREDFAHSCVDCKPRPLDSRTAHERQQARIKSLASEEDVSDKRPRRPPSKSHRKKSKPSEGHINGHTSGKDENVKHALSHDQNHPHAHKKSKSTHKASQSVSSHAPKRSPSYGASKTNPAHPPSPATTPPEVAINFRPQNYSQNLVKDRDVEIVNVNSYARLEISLTLSMWLRDPGKMEKETGCHSSDVFQTTPANLETLKTANQVAHRSSTTSTPEYDFHYLSAVVAIEKDVPLLELNGQIGFQTDYCREASHRWNELTAPVSFVFFHPMLPLYIDTRREGSKARYVRRSCRPNSGLDTYLTDGSEYHFWLVSERRIAPKEQITIPWDVRFPADKRHRMLHVLGLGDDDVGAHEDWELDDVEYEGLADWVDLILSEYGGCACDLGNDCAFARFKQNYAARMQRRSGSQPATVLAQPKKKQRKLKNHTISPIGTGFATNSRAASEGHLEGSPEHDSRSQSGSKPGSRDMTPARQGSFDTLGILTEPTDRDKRKVAMVEDSFRRMEQQQPPRKKKRLSDGTGSSKTKSTSKSVGSQPSSMPHAASERRYVDAGTSGSKLHSPSVSDATQRPSGSVRSTTSRHGTAAAPSRSGSEAPRRNYVDAAVQTDPVEGEWVDSQTTPRPKKRIVSLSKRLLSIRHKARADEEERRKQMLMNGSTTPMEIESPGSQHGAPGSSSTANGVDLSATSSVPRLQVDVNGLKQDLRVQLPPVPAFGTSTSAPTPLSATSPLMQSPFTGSHLANHFGLSTGSATPSPIKKKMSLSDYRSRHSKAQAGKLPTGTAPLKTSMSNVDEPSLDTSGTGVSPATDKAVDTNMSGTGASA